MSDKSGVFRIPSSHVRFPGVLTPRLGLQRHPLPVALRPPPPKKAAKPPKETKTHPSFPSDGQIRAAASSAAKNPSFWASDHIQNFARLGALYCSLILRYSDRRIRETYLYLELKRAIQQCKHRKTSVRVSELPMVARRIIAEIEADIVNLAYRGKRLSAPSNRGYDVVMGSVGSKTSRKCFLIFEEDPRGGVYVRSLKTTEQFNRSRRRTPRVTLH